MGIKWVSYIRKDGELKVYNAAPTWAVAVRKAIEEFNKLSLGVKLVTVTEQPKANIVVKAAKGKDSIDFADAYYEGTVPTSAKFKPDILHGYCGTLRDKEKNLIAFAGIFLPGSVRATDDQKMVITLHEFIHASGLNGISEDGTENANQDHDLEGIMAGQMKVSGKGLIEYMPMKGAKAMPPIRISEKTRCLARALWSHPDQC
jgi:hypothetical protein